MSLPPAAAPSTFARLQYLQTRRQLLSHRDSLADIRDKRAARAWAESFGRVMRDLSTHARAVGIVAADSEDSDVCSMLDSARNSLIQFATAEWLQLAPDLVHGLEGLVQSLSHDVSFGEAFSGLVAETSHAAPSTSAPTNAAPPAAPPSGRTRSSKKGPAVNLTPGDRPAGWKTCARCKQHKKGCAPPKGAKPPYPSCTLCLRDKVECIRGPVAVGPSRSRRHQRSLRPRTARAKSAALPQAASNSGPINFPLPADDPFPEEPPSVLLHGNVKAPLEDLLSWHAEIYAATLECSGADAARRAAAAAHQAAVAAKQAAAAALDAAIIQENNADSRFDTALQRRSTAWKSYLSLLGAAYVESRSSSASSA